MLRGQLARSRLRRDAAVLLQQEDISERRIIGIAAAVVVAIGGGAHVAAFARQPSPAALRRGDHRVIEAERVEDAVIAIAPRHAAVLAHIERNRAGVAEPVDHRQHGRAVGPRERRGGEREPGVIVVMRGADEERRLFHAELPADMARRADAAVDGAHVEEARRLAGEHAEGLRRFLQRGADQSGAERRMVPAAEPAVDLADIEAFCRHIVAQRVDRQGRKLVGVLGRGEALFLVVEQQARAVAGHFDQRDAGVMGAGGRDAGEVSRLAAGDLVTDGCNARAGGRAPGAHDVAAAAGAINEAQRELIANRAEPWMTWSDPHLT